MSSGLNRAHANAKMFVEWYAIRVIWSASRGDTCLTSLISVLMNSLESTKTERMWWNLMYEEAWKKFECENTHLFCVPAKSCKNLVKNFCLKSFCMQMSLKLSVQCCVEQPRFWICREIASCMKIDCVKIRKKLEKHTLSRDKICEHDKLECYSPW